MPRRSAATAGRPLAGTGRHPDEGDTRERILDIAMDLFIEQGYDKTSLRQIADRLGFTQAAIYYHFAAKQDILVALHLRLHELARPAFEQLEEQAGPSGWAVVLRGLVDTTLANRKLFVLHERNQTALQPCTSRDTTATTRRWSSSSAGFWLTARSPPATGQAELRARGAPDQPDVAQRPRRSRPRDLR